jgi:catechol 2,3-dioxygenase-like lactoylglutathione lyase family enzyme
VTSFFCSRQTKERNRDGPAKPILRSIRRYVAPRAAGYHIGRKVYGIKKIDTIVKLLHRRSFRFVSLPNILPPVCDVGQSLRFPSSVASNLMPSPLPIKGLHHVAVATRHPDQSAAFYREVLGFRDLNRPPFDFRGAWLYNYGVQIHIIENPSAAPEPIGEIDSRANHLAFAVDDVGPVKEILAARGISVREQINAGGTRQIFFRDPDGHHIEIAVYGDPSQGYSAGSG